MNMNIGSVSSGYHFISFIAAAKPRSDPPTPQRKTEAVTATKPMAPKTRWPVIIISIIVLNIMIAIMS